MVLGNLKIPTIKLKSTFPPFERRNSLDYAHFFFVFITKKNPIKPYLSWAIKMAGALKL